MSADLKNWTLRHKADGDYDVECCPGVTIELSHDGCGTWTFWNLNIDGERVGGTNILSPSPFVEWLDAEAADRRDRQEIEADTRAEHEAMWG